MTWGAVGGAAVTAVGGALMSGGSGGTTGGTQALRNVSGGGLFDTTRTRKGKEGEIALTPEMQALQQQQFEQAGGGIYGQQAAGLSQGFLGQVSQYDPWAAAETQFQRIEDVMAPQRQQAQMDMESRLFSQGRLGSTGGSNQQQALMSAQEQQRQQNYATSLSEAQAVQNNLINQGMALGQVQGQQSTQGLTNLLGIQQGAMSQLGGGSAPGSTAGTTTQPSLLGEFGTGLATSGLEQLGTSVSGLFSPTQSGTPAATHDVGYGENLGY